MVRAVLAFAFFGTEAFVPLGAHQLRGASPASGALALTGGAIGWIAASWLQERIEARRGPGDRALRGQVGFLLIAVAIASVASVFVSTLPLVVVALAWFLGGAGCGLAYSSGSLLCMAAAPAGQEGEVSGQLQVAECLGTSAGTGLGGALLAALAEEGVTPRAAHSAVFACTLAAALFGVAIARRATSASG